MPLCDVRDPGRVQGVKFIRPPDERKRLPDAPKMWCLQGTPASAILFGKLPERPGGLLLGDEGEFDVLAAISAGHAAVTGCGGAGAPWPSDFAEACALFLLIAAGDNDDPGRKLSDAMVSQARAAGGEVAAAARARPGLRNGSA